MPPTVSAHRTAPLRFLPYHTLPLPPHHSLAPLLFCVVYGATARPPVPAGVLGVSPAGFEGVPWAGRPVKTGGPNPGRGHAGGTARYTCPCPVPGVTGRPRITVRRCNV